MGFFFITSLQILFSDSRKGSFSLYSSDALWAEPSARPSGARRIISVHESDPNTCLKLANVLLHCEDNSKSLMFSKTYTTTSQFSFPMLFSQILSLLTNASISCLRPLHLLFPCFRISPSIVTSSSSFPFAIAQMSPCHTCLF